MLPHSGLEMPFVMTKTTPKSVDLMVEIVVTTKDKDGTTTVLIVNVLHKFYVKNVFIHYLIFRNKSCSITVKHEVVLSFLQYENRHRFIKFLK